MRSGELRRLTCVGGLALLASCGSPPEAERAQPQTVVERKQTMLLATERAIHVIMEDVRVDLARVEAEFAATTASLPACWSLASAEPGLEPFGADKRRQRAAHVASAAHRRRQQLELMYRHYEAALWAVGTEAGRREGSDMLGTRTGDRELDRKIDAALLQLAREVDVDGAAEEANAIGSDRVALERQIRHELPGIGVFSLYKSQPHKVARGDEDEVQAAAVVFARAKPDLFDAEFGAGPAPQPPERVSFVQAVRRHVERGGLQIALTDWRFDPAAADASGTLPVSPEIDPANHVASEICLVRVDKSDPSFTQMRDHVLVSEYRTALRDDATGKLLAVIGWQVRFNVDFAGRMRVLVDPNDQVLPDDRVVQRLLEAASRTAAAGGG
ncbi:MAG: hypothetical protein FJ293_12470 [Planctomycetes bacterium]|nr:hypothetical protein [Planctomycetota bacterium]